MANINMLRDAADEAVTELRFAEKCYREAIAARTPEQWQVLVDEIKHRPTRINVASIVWWDHYSIDDGETSGNPLLKYVKEWDPRTMRTKPYDIKAALIQLGYRRATAATRSQSNPEKGG